MEPKRLHPGAVLENGATLEDGAIFPLIIMLRKKQLHPLRWHRFPNDDINEYIFLVQKQ